MARDAQVDNTWTAAFPKLPQYYCVGAPLGKVNPSNLTTIARGQPAVWRRGDLDVAFRRVTSPRYVDGATELTVLHRDVTEENSSWLVQFDHFASAWEIAGILANGDEQGFSSSLVKSSANRYRGVVDRIARTSSQSLVSVANNLTAAVESLVRKLERLVGIDREHFESLGVLRYQPGEYYKLHHDVGARAMRGVRLLSGMLYLSNVAQGGATGFPVLGTSVQPRPGRLVLWANTLSAAPRQRHMWMIHEALTVREGTKYGVNVWINS